MCLSVKTDNYVLDFLEIFVDRPPPICFFYFFVLLKVFLEEKISKGYLRDRYYGKSCGLSSVAQDLGT